MNCTKFKHSKATRPAIFALLLIGALNFSYAQSKNTPSPATANVELGISYFQAGKFDIALEEAQKGLQKDPNNSAAYTLIGAVYLQTKELPLAEQAFNQAVKIDPLNADAYNNLGLVKCNQGQIDQSIDYFGKALAVPRYPKVAQTLLNAGTCLTKKGDETSAEKYFVKALEIEPFMPLALYQLSKTYYKTNRYELALSRLDALFKQTAPDSKSMALAAQIYQQQGNSQQAQTIKSRLIKQFPNSPEAQRALAGQQLVD